MNEYERLLALVKARYILKNSYVWKDNVPKDICFELEYLT